ncbi:MAG: OmpA family protein [Bacteroidota bacterium]|nr:OmpA family protein [Bacteroidota bacterium]
MKQKRTAAGVVLGLVLLFSLIPLKAQDRPFGKPSAYGVTAGTALNLHHADFRALPGIPNCCPSFSWGTGWGYAAGAFSEFPLVEAFALTLKTMVHSRGAVLTAHEPTLLAADTLLIPGTFEHTIDASILSISIEPSATFQLSKILRAHAGLAVSVNIHSRFEQRERIIEPADRGVFVENALRTRNEFSGDIPNANALAVGLVGAFSALLPVHASGTLFLEPELAVQVGLLPVARGISWNAHGIRGTISLVYRPRTAVPPPPPPPPEKPPPEPVLSAEIRGYGTDDEGNDTPSARLRIEEFVGVRLLPVLPFVFFDENDDRIPLRYRLLSREETTGFSFGTAYTARTSAVDIHHDVLNIIGKRLAENTSCSIVVTGCNADVGPEKRNISLSRKRAQRIRAYLHDVWGIPERRMELKVRNLPVLNSPVVDEDGCAENRRVEISSDDAAVLGPIAVSDTLKLATRPVIRFRPRVTAEAGIASWSVDVLRRGDRIARFEGADSVPALLVWDITTQEGIPFDDTTAFSYRLCVTDKRGHTVETPFGEIAIERLTIHQKRRERSEDRWIDRYALILFDFNSSDIPGHHRALVDTIRSRLHPRSTVFVTGHTDRMGDERYNTELSARRAQEVLRALGTARGYSAGFGERAPLYGNDTPEERMLNRTVQVRVETPVEYNGEEP